MGVPRGCQAGKVRNAYIEAFNRPSEEMAQNNVASRKIASSLLFLRTHTVDGTNPVPVDNIKHLDNC